MKLGFKKTKRLIIRTLEPKDYEAWKNGHLNKLEAQNIWDKGKRKPTELTKSEFKRLLSSQKKMRDNDEFYDLAVFKKSTGEIVGNVAAMNIVRSVTQTAFLGYFIHNNHWGNGYGKESVLAMIDIAFNQLKLHRIEAGVEPNNRRSILLAKSVGLRKEGLKKRVVHLRGGWQDLTMYSATCEDFGMKWKGQISLRKKS